MSGKTHICLFLLLLILFSCRKEKIKNLHSQSTEGSVEFFFNGTIDGTPYLIEAGRNNYYMHSGFLYDTSLKTFFLNGIFSDYQCHTCPRSLHLTLIDDTIKNINDQPNISNIIPGNYYYYSPFDSTLSKLKINSITLDSISGFNSYTFLINNNPVANTPSLNHTLNITNIPMVFSLTLNRYNSQAGCQSSLTNTFLVQNDLFYCNLSAKSFSGITTFTITSNKNTVPVSYTLHYGNGQFVAFNNYTYTIVHNYTYTTFTTSVYPYVIAKDNLGNIASFSIHLNPYSFTFHCIPSYTCQLTPQYNKIFKNKLIIKWIDENQNEYISTANSQPVTSYFNIISVSDFNNNENGNPTKKITAQLKVRLYNKNNPQQWKELQGNLAFAVAYK
ncbi:MAG: hypothetical protein N3F09_01475 [Bacteroidia bacterium]|nr:hypothetical protein [Bacteroidia bacterium]